MSQAHAEGGPGYARDGAGLAERARRLAWAVLREPFRRRSWAELSYFLASLALAGAGALALGALDLAGLALTAAFVGAVGDGASLELAVAADPPDVAVVDIRMPPTFTDEGLRTAIGLRRDHPEVGILVCSQYVETRYAADLLGGGAAERRSGPTRPSPPTSSSRREPSRSTSPTSSRSWTSRRRPPTTTGCSPCCATWTGDAGLPHPPVTAARR